MPLTRLPLPALQSAPTSLTDILGFVWRPPPPPISRLEEEGGLHTLCLLDIKVHELDFDEMISTGKPVYMPPTFMTASTAASQLLEIEERRKDGACASSRPAIALARVGAADQVIVSGTLERLAKPDVDDILGDPLHSLIVCGELRDLEKAFFDHFVVDKLKEKT